MKRKDRFGNVIYDHIFQKMVEYASKLQQIGFQESINKPNLFYWKREDVIVFADMRGYKDNWGRFFPIWDKKRMGAPRFYHKILHYNKKTVGKLNRELWNLFQKIKSFGVKFFTIEPYAELNSFWKCGLIPTSQFFLTSSNCPIVVDDPLEPDLFYCGYCRKCGQDLNKDKIFCSDCRQNHPNLTKKITNKMSEEELEEVKNRVNAEATQLKPN